jgi:GNAT superfamily N-acetyltransferase
MSYSIIASVPSPEVFCMLRKESGLSPRSVESATKALPNTVYAVTIQNDLDNTPVGMGRLVGDGSLCLTVSDVCVLPGHQKKGLGRLIMASLMDYIKKNTTRDCYINLMADGDARYLYEKYGFVSGLPESLGMYYRHS